MTTTSAFARDVFAAVDKREGEAFALFFAPEGTFTFGNAPPVVGPEAIASACNQFFGTLSAMHHTIDAIWEPDNSLIAQLKIDYTRKDGRQVTLPCVSIMRRDEAGRIADYCIYMDVNPVFA